MGLDRSPLTNEQPWWEWNPAYGTEAEFQQRLEFLEMLADGCDLRMNGIPWREAYIKFQAIVQRRDEDMARVQFAGLLEDDAS